MASVRVRELVSRWRHDHQLRAVAGLREAVAAMRKTEGRCAANAKRRRRRRWLQRWKVTLEAARAQAWAAASEKYDSYLVAKQLRGWRRLAALRRARRLRLAAVFLAAAAPLVPHHNSERQLALVGAALGYRRRVVLPPHFTG